jgi:hypothetical protein
VKKISRAPKFTPQPRVSPAANTCEKTTPLAEPLYALPSPK